MKKLYLCIALLGSIALANGQSKIDFEGQRELRQYKMEKRQAITSERMSPIMAEIKSRTQEQNATVIVDLAEGYSIEDIEAFGAIVRDHRGKMAIVTLPMSKVEEFSAMQAVKKVTFGSKAFPKLDKARGASNVEWAHMGIGLGTGIGTPYTGAGVIVGAMDQGMDPNHIAFFDADGNNRVKRVWTLLSQDGTSTAYDTPEKIAGFSYDFNTTSHGTHVAGIMAGGYKTNGYYGVATGADIALSCGQFYPVNLIMGLVNIIDYASQEGKPAVVNFSIGNNTGSHDGTDAMSRYLELLGEEAIICISAGNEGTDPIVLSKTFTESDSQVKSFVVENDYVVDYVGKKGLYTGSLDIWCNDSSSIKVTPIIYDVVADTIVYEYPTCSSPQDAAYVSAGGSDYQSDGDMYDANFAKSFDGWIGVGAAVNSGDLVFSEEAGISFPNNNRYNVYVEFYLDRTTKAATNSGNFVFGVKIDGVAGQRVDVYCDGIYSKFSSENEAGWDAGTTNGTINGMACGKNVIVVGSFNSRNSYTTIGGTSLGMATTVGDISNFTSYGELVDGRTLPHICAPGCFLISSISTHYANYAIGAGAYTANDFAAKVNENNRNHYWDVMQGTSMSAPFMTGAVALWLEANPYLKHKDILEIAQQSAKKDNYVLNSINPLQWGAGKLDVYAGLKLAISSLTNGIEGVVSDPEKRQVITPINDRVYEVFIAGEGQLEAVLYNMSGQPVVSARAEGNTVVIDATDVAPGVYVLSVQGHNAKCTNKLLLK